MARGKIGTDYLQMITVVDGEPAAPIPVLGIAAAIMPLVRNLDTAVDDSAVPAVVEIGDGRYLLNLRGAFSAAQGAGNYGWSATISSGPLQNSFLFDGTNEFILMSNAASLQFAHDAAFSIGAWVKFTDAGVKAIVSKRLNTGTLRGYALETDAGKLVFKLINTTATDLVQITTVGTFNDGAWHRVDVTWDGTVSQAAANARVYVDGNLEAVTVDFDTLSATIEGGASFAVAAVTFSALHLAGNVAGVTVYNKELSLAELALFCVAGEPVDHRIVGPAANLVEYWFLGTGDAFPVVTGQFGVPGTAISMEAADIVDDHPGTLPLIRDMQSGVVEFSTESRVVLSAALNSTTNLLTVNAWLERDGEVDTAVTSLALVFRNADGTALTPAPTITGPDAQGVFKATVASPAGFTQGASIYADATITPTTGPTVSTYTGLGVAFD